VTWQNVITFPTLGLAPTTAEALAGCGGGGVCAREETDRFPDGRDLHDSCPRISEGPDAMRETCSESDCAVLVKRSRPVVGSTRADRRPWPDSPAPALLPGRCGPLPRRKRLDHQANGLARRSAHIKTAKRILVDLRDLDGWIEREKVRGV